MISKECPRLLSIKLASDLWVVYCTVKWSDNVCQPVKCDIYYWIYPLEIGFASALFTSYQTGTYIWLSRDYERRHYIKLYRALVSRQLKPWKASCGPVTEVACQWGVTFIFFLTVYLIQRKKKWQRTSGSSHSKNGGPEWRKDCTVFLPLLSVN